MSSESPTSAANRIMVHFNQSIAETSVKSDGIIFFLAVGLQSRFPTSFQSLPHHYIQIRIRVTVDDSFCSHSSFQDYVEGTSNFQIIFLRKPFLLASLGSSIE